MREVQILVLVSAALLSGCLTPATRQDAGKFKTIQAAQIDPGKVRDFSDCLMDGFERAHYSFKSVSTRQQVRASGYRVETLAGGSIIMMSADIFFDGRVELFEIHDAILVNTSGERESFAKCVDQFGS